MPRASRAIALLVVLAAALPPAGAMDGAGTLDDSRRTLSWQGRHFDGAAAGDPSGCTPETCETYLATIGIGRRYWKRTRASLEFAIRWPSEYDDFDLYVYRPDGSRVPSIQSNVSSSEAALDHAPQPGTYRVDVVPKAVKDSAYEGAIQVEPRRRFPGRPRGLLPNLRTLPPRNFIIAAPAFYQTGEPIPAEGVSCYPDETAETGHTRCLRFDNVIANTGRGDLRMRFLLSGLGSDQRIEQIIDRTKGPSRYRDAGRYEWHETHGHAHYEGFAEFRLYAADLQAERLEPVGEGVKSGFCLEDTELHWWRRRGNGPMGITFPDCDVPSTQDEEGTWGVMGITRGWADVYTWDLPDQYIPIDGIPDGTYVLAARADASELLRETREDDNSAWALLQLSGDQVDVLRTGRGSPRSALA